MAQFSSGLSGIDFGPSVDFLGAQRNALANASLSQSNQYDLAAQPNKLALLGTQVTAGQIQNQYDQAAQPNKLAILANTALTGQLANTTTQQDQAGAQVVRNSATAMAAGDPNATATALAADPVRAQAVITGTDAQNASQRARMANNFNLTASASASVLALPDEAQEAGYNALRPGLIAAGVSESMLPAKYPGAAALVAHRNAALSVIDSMKLQSEYPSTNNQSPMQQGLPTGAALLFHQAHAQGVDPALVLGSAQIESGMGANPDRPGAQYKGMLQLGDQEWAAQGGTPQNRDDPAMQAILGVAQIKKTQAALGQALGRPPENWETYFAHQQGVGGLQAYLADPNRSAIDAAASTAEGRQKGRAWAQQAVIGNIPADQRAALGDNPTSGQFLNAWQQRFGRAVSQLGGGQAQPASAPGAPPVAPTPSGASPPPVQMASASATNGMPAVMSDAGGGGAPQVPDNVLAATMARLRANLPPPGSPGAPPQIGETTVTGPPTTATMTSPADGSVAPPSGPPPTPLSQPSASAGGIPQNALASFMPPVGASVSAPPPNALSDLMSRYGQPQPGTAGAPAMQPPPAGQPQQATSSPPSQAPGSGGIATLQPNEKPYYVAGKYEPVNGLPGYVYVNRDGQKVPVRLPNAPGSGTDIKFEGGHRIVSDKQTGALISDDAGFPDAGRMQTVPGPNGTIVYQSGKPVGTIPFSTQPAQIAAYTRDSEIATKIAQQNTSSEQQLQQTLEARNLAKNLPTGAGGEDRAAMSSWLKTYAPAGVYQAALNTGFVPDSPQAEQTAKLLLRQAATDEQQLGGSGGLGMTEKFQKANPSLNMQPESIQAISNLKAVIAQSAKDYGDGATAFFNQQQDGLLHQGGQYQPLSNFNQQWFGQKNVGTRMASVDAMNNKPYAEWSKGLSPADQDRALQIIGRIDPTTTVNGPQGRIGVVKGAPGQGSAAPAQGASGAPSVGTVMQGFRFNGGDPSSPASWARAQ